MKFSEQWLREWVSPKMNTRELGDLLTMAGLEIDNIEAAAPALKKVVVAEIVDISPHADADRLRVCQVRIGAKKMLQIVCGATNARKGLKAPLALIGSRLPNGTEIKESKLRGVSSSGMLCSTVELGLEESADGLMELGDDAVPGQAIYDYLQLDDQTIEIDLTPNRGDCLSVAGVAREVAALTGAKLKGPRTRKIAIKSKKKINVAVSAKKACPHYVGRVVEGINPSAKTPIWMREKLRRSGIRCHNPVVDVTNYVLLELGQPLHAFDLDRLQGGIRVVLTSQKTKLQLLDGSEVSVGKGALLISDQKKPLALAGIMGGLGSSVTDKTRDIFLESAFFSPDDITGRARELGLQTDSSFRFERGVDPGLQRIALDRATELLLEIVGGKAGPVVEKTAKEFLPKRKVIALRANRVEKVLGINISKANIQQTLKRLGMTFSANQKGWRVVAPSYRFDLIIEEDLIEEIARVYGYDNIPESTPRGSLDIKVDKESVIDRNRIKDVLVNRDYQEVINYSFVDPELLKKLDPDSQPVALSNPIAADMAVMRTSLWPGLLKTAQYNLNRQQSRIRLFELGHNFHGTKGATQETEMLACLVSGAVLPEQWGAEGRDPDFYELKGDLEAVFGLTGAAGDFSFQKAVHPALHTGQSAQIRRNGVEIGWIGALHPRLQSEMGLQQGVFLLEVSICALQAAKIPRYEPISRFPAIRRDLTFIIDVEIPVAQVLEFTRKTAGAWLVDLELFGDYRGEGIDSGRKSLSLSLILQDSSRTLKEVEVETVITRVIKALTEEFGAELRT